ncbi:MAG: hypothetical protein CMA30_05290 [Euryarchaeota archaeon]|nr:hypothetical protein [Euryarchaeota archaeon]
MRRVLFITILLIMTSLSSLSMSSANPQNDGSTNTITVSETWSTDSSLDGDVIVSNGATLTVNGDITISDGSSITVQEGGVLDLYGGLNGENLNAALRVDNGSIIHADFGSLSGSGELIINFDLYTTQNCNVTINGVVTNVSNQQQVEIDMTFDGNPFDIVFEIYSFILPEISSIQTRDVNGVIQTIHADGINQTGSSLSWKGDASFELSIDGTFNSMDGQLEGADLSCSGACNIMNSTLIGSAPINIENGTSLTIETSSILGSRTDEDIIVHDSATISYDTASMTGTGGTTDAWIRLLSQRVIQTNLMDAGATVHYEGLGYSGDIGDNILDETGKIDLGVSESRRIVEWVNGDGVYSSEDSDILITLNGGTTTWNHGYDIKIDPAPMSPYHEVSIDLPFVSIDSVVPEDTTGTANKGLGVMVTVSNTGDASVTTNIRCYEGDDLADTTTLLITLEVDETKKIPTTWWANASGNKALTCKALIPTGFNSLADSLTSASGATSTEISFKDAEDTEDAPIIIYATIMIIIIIGTITFNRRNARNYDTTETVEKDFEEEIIEQSED